MTTDPLADKIREVYRRAADRAPATTPLRIEAVGYKPTRRDRSPRLVSIAAAVLVVAGLGSILMITRDRSRTPLIAETAVDLGPVGQFPVGSVTTVDVHRMFVVNDDADGIIAFGDSSPHLGCRLVQRDDIVEAAERTDNPDVAFFDPCHGSSFDRHGTKIGGPAARAMSRYRVDISTGQVIVDTSLLIPGPWVAGLEGGVLPRNPSGIVDETAITWHHTWALVTERFPGEMLVTLGTFHDPDTGISTIEFTYDGLDGELLAFDPNGTAPPAIDPNQIRRKFTTSSSTITTFGPHDDWNTQSGGLIANDGTVLQIVITTPISTNGPPPNTPLAALNAIPDLLHATYASLA